MYEDDRIRRKNALLEIATEVICDSCGTEFDCDEVDGDENEPCPKCDKKTLRRS
jgi:hypothetical protein